MADSQHMPSVLVVEDNWQIASSLRRWLEDEEMQVLGPAPTVARAEALMNGKAPDIAVVDLNLRGELSYGLIDALDEKSVQVIVVTGYAEASRLLKKDACVLEKPISRESLMNAIRSGKGRRKPGAAR